MTELAAQLQIAYEELEPQFKALRASMSALKTAVRLASEEKPDALPMQKALVKLQAAARDGHRRWQSACLPLRSTWLPVKVSGSMAKKR